MREPLKDFVVSIDFDDTIYTNKFPDTGDLMPGMKALVNTLYDQGFVILINTCRAQTAEQNAKQRLLQDDVMFDLINENAQYLIDFYDVDCRKLSADIHIDDKNTGGIPPPDMILSEIYDRWEAKQARAIMHDKVYMTKEER